MCTKPLKPTRKGSSFRSHKVTVTQSQQTLLWHTFFQEIVGCGSPLATQGISTDWPGWRW